MTPRTGRGDLGVGQRKGMTLGLTGFDEEVKLPHNHWSHKNGS